MEDMTMQQGVSEYLDKYIALLQGVEAQFKKTSDAKMPAREVAKLFDIVFKKTRKTPSVCLLKEGDRVGERYDVWVSTNGIGLRNRFASRSNPINDIKDIIQLRDDAEALIQGLYDAKLPQAAKDMEDFLAFLPEFDGGKMKINLPQGAEFEMVSKNDEWILVDSLRLSASYWGGVHMELSGMTKMSQHSMIITDKESLKKDTSEEFAERLWSILDMMKMANVPMRTGLKMKGWQKGTIVTEINSDLGTDGPNPGGERRWVLKHLYSSRASNSVENLCRARDIQALKKILPMMPYILQQAEKQADEYVERGKVIEGDLRKRFSKQVLAEAL